MSASEFVRHAILFALRPWLWDTRPLKIENLSSSPFTEFGRWFSMAKRCFWLEFGNGMCLSTIGEDGFPDSRMVLLKSFDTVGFVFYTNLRSRKGRELAADPRAALNFYWEPLQRQIRIQGIVEPVSPGEADAYFATRPRTSQLGAWASAQSEDLGSREDLIERVNEYRRKYSSQPVPRPPHWSGFRLVPERFEFWKLKPNRLHDRFSYIRRTDGLWHIQRLYP